MLGEHAADRLDAADAAPVLVDERSSAGVAGRVGREEARRGLENVVVALEFGDLLLRLDLRELLRGRVRALPGADLVTPTQLRRDSAEPMPSFSATARRAADSFG
ncbi:hypothetical protein [Kitasatospora sp. NPDC059327]|uniref:hypothetical protein n=1 Tax=Kitasatospora sp. NPDC059327 TaxID=3346803 RepID=UPI0036A7D9BD